MRSDIASSIVKKPGGSVFCALDFLSLGQRNTIDQTLIRLCNKGFIKKAGTGIFYKPIKNPLLGDLPPSIDDIIQIYAKKFGYKIQVQPAKAANLLGLTQQVPAQHIYLTNGPSRSLVMCGTQVTLKHVCPKKLIGIDTKVGLVVQALYYFGATGVTDTISTKLRNLLDDKDRTQIASNFSKLPGWMQKIISRSIFDA